MKMTDVIESLLRQGRHRKELIELGFPKNLVTRVYRQLKAEEATQRKAEANRLSEPEGGAPASRELEGPFDEALLSRRDELEERLVTLELWLSIMRLTHIPEDFTCPRCLGVLRGEERLVDTERGVWAVAFICKACGYEAPELPEPRIKQDLTSWPRP